VDLRFFLPLYARYKKGYRAYAV
jgi:hypothetical protein